MRRSKSNPAKYAKGYRKISQRRMTSHVDNEEEEIKRLRDMLRTSTEHLSKYCPDFENGSTHDNHEDDVDIDDDNNKRNHKKGNYKDNQTTNVVDSNDDTQSDTEINSYDGDDQVNNNNNDDDDTPQYIIDDTALILPSRKRKDGPKTPIITLTPEEIKAAKNKHKALQRKLQQIETRHEKKRRRTELYQKLSEHAVSDTEMKLLEKSSELGKKMSKKQMLKKILQKERAGIPLTEEEQDMLYVERDEIPNDSAMIETYNRIQSQSINDSQSNDVEVQPLEFPSSGRKKKKKKKKMTNTSVDKEINEIGENDITEDAMTKIKNLEANSTDIKESSTLSQDIGAQKSNDMSESDNTDNKRYRYTL